MYTNSNLIKKYLIKFGKDFERRVDSLYCLVCNQNIVVSLHVSPNKHISGLKRKSQAKSCTSSAKFSWCKSDYFFEMTKALIAANIRFTKLNSPIYNKFLQK